ncbi:MAG: transcription termination factor Rho [Dehalococcoidia bacterium SM23_28_1]|nr:MAG: transcription termination factor Rho [Dehalococcoidia bacterium SM23_28_1]
MNLAELEAKTREELMDVAKDMGITGHTALRKQDLVFRILQARAEQQGNLLAGGVLEIADEGYGFLRGDGLRPGGGDVYVSQSQIRRFGLRTGDYVTGQVRPPKDSEKYYGLLRVEAINSIDPEIARNRPHFGSLTPVFPDELINLETSPKALSARLVNLVAPIGHGQRGMIVSPPKAGKTMLLKSVAKAMVTNYEDIHLMILLIGERPEEVTDWRRTVVEAEVVAATFDDAVEDQTRVAEMGLERAKRLVECGKDVVVLLDGITRLTRAYNLAVPPSGRTLSGGIDPASLHPSKRFFGAARNTEEGGSLTIIATCLVETGSRMDEVIYEEFKGTGNMEIHLARRLAEKHIFPAIDVARSSTRRDDLLFDADTYRQVILLRRMLALVNADASGVTEATQLLLDRLSKTQNNAEFLATLKDAI